MPCLVSSTIHPPMVLGSLGARQALPPKAPVLPPLFTTPDNIQPPSASAGPPNDTGIVPPSLRATPPQKLVIGDFLPLPTIEASPICPSPASFLPFEETPIPAVDAFSSQDRTQAHSRMALRVVFPPPTWISTPPTPPRDAQKAPTCDSQKPPHLVPPSASFPVSIRLPTPRASPASQLKRCLSCPAIVSRSQIFPSASHSSQPRSPKASCIKGVHGRKRSQTVFHVPTDVGDSPIGERIISNTGPEPLSSTTGHVSGTSTSQNNTKDAIRIFYAVQELLMTEMDYVRDLRILFNAYIQQLSSFETRTPTFSRNSPSFMSAPWANPAGQIGQFVGPFDGMVSSPSSISVKPIFSSTETESLGRNLKDILQLHERFLSALRDVLSPLGVSGTPGSGYLPRDDPDAILAVISAVKAVSEQFVSEASEFAIYKTFCAGHLEALNLLRRAMLQHPSEWDSFEQRCSALASEIYQAGSDSLSQAPEWTQSGFSDVPTNGGAGLKRRRSTSTLPSEVKPSSQPIKFDTRQQKLTFSDYLIKPTQRICKYPLLLEQLKPKKSFAVPDDVRSASTNAIKAMRDVAASVDKAYHEREVSTRSSLIASRFILPSYSPNSHSTKLPYSPLYSITPLFLSSLGDCILAGSLDIMHSSPQRPFRDVSSITAKYLGAFLYPGGYLILAKVHKGKRYEPQHWLSIADFVVNEGGNDEVMLPHSFHLSSKDVHFELAAACKKEKDIWLRAIEKSMKHEPIWSDVPLPSYTGIRRTPSGDSRTYTISYANTSYAAPGGSDIDSSEPAFHMDSRSKKSTLKKVDIVGQQDQPRPPSRHSSTASIKSIFSPVGHDPNTIYINRSLFSGRLQVENDLEDVASRDCLDARKQAILHEEILFPPPPGHHRETWSFSRSNSAISVANLAKSRLSRQESLRVPRRKTRCDSMTAFTPQSELTNLAFPSRSKSKRFSAPLPRQLLMTPIEPLQASPATTDSPTPSISPQSLFSSAATASIPSTRCSSPVSRSSSPSSMGHRHSRSLIRNVKGLFRTGSSPTSLLPPCHGESCDGSVSHSSSLLGRWKNSVSRRRSHSAPEDDMA